MNKAERLAHIEKQPFKKIGAQSAGISGIVGTAKEIFANREMLSLLIKRDLKSRYKDSSLGFVWTLVRPLTQLAIYFVVVGQFLGAARGIPEFAIFIFTGLTAYGLFGEIVLSGTAAIVGNAGLIKKIYLPREIFPLAATGTALFNFAVQLIILLLATLAVGSFPTAPNVLYALPAFAILMLFGLSFSLILSAWNVYLRDIQYLVEVLVMILMWASPIIYSWKYVKDTEAMNGILLAIYTNNPITLAVLGFQKAFWTAGNPENAAKYPWLAPEQYPEFPENLMGHMLIACAVGAVLLVISQRIFAKLQGNFAQAL